MHKTRERLFWEVVYRMLTGLANAVKVYQLEGEEPAQLIVRSYYAKLGPRDPEAAALFFRSQGVKVVQ